MVLGREWSLKLLQFPEKRRPSPAADSFTGHPCLSLACWYSDRLMCAVAPSPLASHPARPVSSLQGEEDFTSGIWGKWSLRPVPPAPPPQAKLGGMPGLWFMNLHCLQCITLQSHLWSLTPHPPPASEHLQPLPSWFHLVNSPALVSLHIKVLKHHVWWSKSRRQLSKLTLIWVLLGTYSLLDAYSSSFTAAEQQSHKISISIPSLQMRKLRLIEKKWLALTHSGAYVLSTAKYLG